MSIGKLSAIYRINNAFITSGQKYIKEIWRYFNGSKINLPIGDKKPSKINQKKKQKETIPFELI